MIEENQTIVTNKKGEIKIKKYKKNQIEVITAIIAVVVLYIILEGVGITCPIKYITGISCAGCGMSRAWMALFRLDISGAFYYHPLFWMPPILLLIFINKNKIKINIYKKIMFTAVLLFVIIYLYRMIDGNNDIVVFKPQNNIILRFIRSRN